MKFLEPLYGTLIVIAIAIYAAIFVALLFLSFVTGHFVVLGVLVIIFIYLTVFILTNSKEPDMKAIKIKLYTGDKLVGYYCVKCKDARDLVGGLDTYYESIEGEAMSHSMIGFTPTRIEI